MGENKKIITEKKLDDGTILRVVKYDENKKED